MPTFATPVRLPGAVLLSNATIIFGKQNLSGMLAIINASESDYKKLTNAIYGCNGTAQDMTEMMQDNLSGQLTILMSQLQELVISFGDILMPTIRNIITKFQELADKFNALPASTKETIAQIALVVATLGPVLIVVGKVVGSVGSLIKVFTGISAVISKVKTAFTAAKTAMTALNSTLLTNPIFLVITAITALVSAFIYFWNTSDGFRNFWIGLWEEIQNTLYNFFDSWETGWNAITDFFVNTWNSIKTTVSTTMENIKTTISTVWDNIGLAWKPDNAEKLPGLKIGEVSGICWKNSTKLQISYENLMDWIYSICKLVGGTANIKMLRKTPDSDEYFFKFDLSESTDRSVLQDENPHVIFSDSNNNLLTFSFEKDRSKMANFAEILGAGEGSDRKRTGYFLGYDPHSSTAADAPSHYERYEFYVDAKDISDEVQGENGETTTIPTADYLEMLRQRGAEKLQPVVTSAEFEIVSDSPQYRYQRDYFVGDFVTVRHDKFGLELPKIQLTGMIESIDQNGRKLTPTFEVKEW